MLIVILMIIVCALNVCLTVVLGLAMDSLLVVVFYIGVVFCRVRWVCCCIVICFDYLSLRFCLC